MLQIFFSCLLLAFYLLFSIYILVITDIPLTPSQHSGMAS